jgi:hypothetical protein
MKIWIAVSEELVLTRAVRLTTRGAATLRAERTASRESFVRAGLSIAEDMVNGRVPVE